MNQTPYHQSITLHVREFLRTQIEEEEYAPGVRLPEVSELASLFGVQEETVSDALKALKNEGLLQSVFGEDGIYVVGGKMERQIDVLEGFAQTMRDQNLVPSYKLINRTRRKAGNKYAHLFSISPEDDLIYIKRLCLANEEPISLEETYIPLYLVPKIEGMDLSVFSIYEIYQMYGITLERASQTLDLVHVDMNDARLLNIPRDLPVMLFQSTTWDERNRVIEFNRNYVRGDKCDFSVSFRK